ncbi:tetratricopeptide repeat protein 14 homolog isoform X2 [Sitophilus oryzae]|uniref:Tetratricopeptide repeat protein 14 homolog isoform X2 n=1 Tax=Sitophilus oryzae TaxID=7048 RepID=A0A6J2Y664_SITOR|nr:tetratricopeptide repeat protein 14 homolog isoform X2 [Sitophilus oryzae]
MEPMNNQLITKAIGFHGQQFQKLWEGEFGDNDLARRGVKDFNFQVYGQRQRNLPFQDRGKRLNLQQFIVKKAEQIFSTKPSELKSNTTTSPAEDLYSVTPPFETYINADRQKRLQFFTENVKVGDLILGTIVSKQQSGMMLKVLCTAGNDGNVKYAADINIKAFCPVANVIPAVDKKGVSRSYMMNDYVCCEVLEVIADTDKMVCGMKGTTRKPGDPEHQPPLGLISTDDFPLVYKKSLDHKNESYESVLEKSVGFNNPNNIQYLADQMGINEHVSLMSGLRGRFPENEYATELRQVQASKWAYRNVADGIDHFKAGKHVEAFQCLNKALNIDPRNVEGLVARGALYANSGNFQKAIEDFETALKLNQNHANARKYMGETLVALGRSYEEENKIEEARKAYQSCLSIIPYHEEAKNSLEFLKNKEKQTPKNFIEPAELLLPNLASVRKPTADVNDALNQLLKNEEVDKKDKKKKKKEKKKLKKKRHSSSSSSSSSSGSGESSSSSSSSSSDSSSSSGDSDFKKRKKHRSRREKRENSLSPLSKRMAMMDSQAQDPSTSNFNFNKPATNAFDFGFEEPQKPKTVEVDYEAKVKSFLLETKDDSDYETKVRKFLEESAKWKKGKSDTDKKKKKKKEKKAKKDSKKKKKKEKDKLKRKGVDLDLDDHKKLRDAIKKELNKEKKKKHSLLSDDEEYFLQKSGISKRFIENLPDLEELESKLNAYYALEKESKRSELSESPKHSLLDSPSPTREQKARQAVAEAAASAGKWKMHIGPATQPSSRFKKKQERPPSPEWPPELPPEKPRSRNNFDNLAPKKAPLPPLPTEKAVSVRKQMAMKEPPAKHPSESPKKFKPTAAPPAPPGPKIPQGQVVLDKFGNFRLMTPPEMKKGHDVMSGTALSSSNKGDQAGRRPPEPPGRPRSASNSPKRRSRSRSRPSRSRSSSLSRSRSRSYRSRSRSYYSRSRSRSGSAYSRSRSRSRSYSGDRRFRRRGGFRGQNNRGTYYKPRYPNPRFDNRGRGRGFYRDRFDRNFRGRGRPYDYRGNRRNNRGRYPRGGYRDYRDRRYDRSRSRDRSRSYSRSPDRSDDSPRRTREESKEKINKYSEGQTAENVEQPVKHDGPLSEGEDRDDYTNNDSNKVIDRDAFAGKWADKDDNDREPSPPGSRDIPVETNIEEMDKFLDKVKKDKKEEMLERNKDMLKNKP